MATWLSEVARDGVLDLSFRHGAGDAALFHPIAEENQQRDPLHAEGSGGARVLIDVQLAEADIRALVGQLFDDRPDHPARPAPRRPEIDHEPARGDGRAEIRIRQLDRTITG